MYVYLRRKKVNVERIEFPDKRSEVLPARAILARFHVTAGRDPRLIDELKAEASRRELGRSPLVLNMPCDTDSEDAAANVPTGKRTILYKA